LDALLALQTDDSALAELEERGAALARKVQELDRQRQFAADALARARNAVEGEERKQRDLQTRISAHKQMHDRNLAQFEAVKKMREANAAMAQAELTRKVLADDESELHAMQRRVGDLRQAVAAQEGALATIQQEQEGARAEISAEREALEASVREARAKREEAARGVPRTLLSRYERIRARRRAEAVFPLRGPSCGNCDTAIPLQRRHMMQASGAVEVCEACGVLLYATN
jgi:predicted  nucleic acid-binding Zn-ribbon protein